MGRVKVFCLALLSLLAVGVMTAAAASAESTPLPDIHTALPGETYPLALGGHLISNIQWQNSGGGFLESKEVSELLLINELSSLGSAFVEFLTAQIFGGSKCHTTGASEANGEVILPGVEWHLVYTALSSSETLEAGLWLLFTKFTVFCNAGLFEATVTGPLLSRVNVPTPEAGKEGDSNDIEIATRCRAPGVQELPYYYNDSLERVPTTLLFNVSGTGNVQGCEEVPGTLLLTPETGSLATMFSVLF